MTLIKLLPLKNSSMSINRVEKVLRGPADECEKLKNKIEK